MIDPISDMLTRIRNAQMAGHAEVAVPASKLKLAVARILERRGFVERVDQVTQDRFAGLNILLRYETHSRTRRVPAITGIERVSREGQRIYSGKKDIRTVRNGYGITIISTSKGVMTGDEARKKGVGGEVICRVW